MNTSETWNDFEKDALLVKEITTKQAGDTVQLLQDAIELLAIALPIGKIPDNNHSTLAKMGLLSHNFNTLKCSADLALRGYYLQSQNILRIRKNGVCPLFMTRYVDAGRYKEFQYTSYAQKS